MKYNIFFITLLLFILSACTESLDGFESNSTENGQSGSITRFVTHNNFMYVLNPNQIITYSLENPGKPSEKSVLSTDYGLETIIIYDNTIYVGSRSALYILSIDNPAEPQLLSKSERWQFPFAGGCDPVVVKDNYAFSTIKIIENICGTINAESVLIVYDVTNKNDPEFIGSYPLDEPNGLGYKGNYLVVCDTGADALVVFDISDPTNLIRLEDNTISINKPVDLIVNQNTMIVSTADNFEIFDVEDIESIDQIGSIAK